jgi:predicted nucleotidyltransferase
VLPGLPHLPDLPSGVGDHVRAVLGEVTDALARLPGVRAVVLGGSWVTGQAAPGYASDLDLYVYAPNEPGLTERRAIAELQAAPGTAVEVGNTYWEAGDEWTHRGGPPVDVMYRSPAWLDAELDRVLVEHRATLGYSTCVWHNVRCSAPLVDVDGWYARAQQRAAAPYPEPLRAAVLARNVPLLHDANPALSRQLVKAADRGDRVGMLDRAAALLASYFDVLFALNRVTHPGEKRQLVWAAQTCPWRPDHLGELLERFAAAVGGEPATVPAATDALVAPLLDLVDRHGSS